MIDEETKKRIYRDAGMNALPQHYSIPASVKLDGKQRDDLTFDLRWHIHGTDEETGSALKVGVIRRDPNVGQYRFIPGRDLYFDSSVLREIARFLDASNTGREKILS